MRGGVLLSERACVINTFFPELFFVFYHYTHPGYFGFGTLAIAVRCRLETSSPRSYNELEILPWQHANVGAHWPWGREGKAAMQRRQRRRRRAIIVLLRHCRYNLPLSSFRRPTGSSPSPDRQLGRSTGSLGTTSIQHYTTLRTAVSTV